MSLFDDLSMFVGHVVLWGFLAFTGLFLGYFLLCAAIAALAWLFKRFDEGHLYIQNLICKAPKKANEK